MAQLPDEEYDEGGTTLTIETVPAREVRLGMFIVFPDGSVAPVEDIEVTAETIRFITEDMDYETGRSSQCQVLAETDMDLPEDDESAEATPDDESMEMARRQITLAARDRGWEISEHGAHRNSSTGFQVQVIPVPTGAKVRVVDPETFEAFDDSVHGDARAALSRGNDILMSADRPLDKLPKDPEPETDLQVALSNRSGWDLDEDDVAWRLCSHDPRYQAIIRPDGDGYASELLYMPSEDRVELCRGGAAEVLAQTEVALLTPHLRFDGMETAVARLRKKLA